jgi:hypothetical protein
VLSKDARRYVFGIAALVGGGFVNRILGRFEACRVDSEDTKVGIPKGRRKMLEGGQQATAV